MIDADHKMIIVYLHCILSLSGQDNIPPDNVVYWKTVGYEHTHSHTESQSHSDIVSLTHRKDFIRILSTYTMYC